MRLQGQREGSRKSTTQLLTYSLSSPTASLFSLCEHRDKGWIHGLFKSPGGPFSSSHQLLSIHLAHFLKAYSPGTGKVGVLQLLQAQSQGSQPNGARHELQSRDRVTSCLPLTCMWRQREGHKSKPLADSKDCALGNLYLGTILVVFWPNRKIISHFYELCLSWARLWIQNTLWLIINGDSSFFFFW